MIISPMSQGVRGMVSDDKLLRLAQAAGYSFIPPQELFTAQEDDLLSNERVTDYTGNAVSLCNTDLRHFLSASSSRTSSLRETLLSWIQSYVHV